MKTKFYFFLFLVSLVYAIDEHEKNLEYYHRGLKFMEEKKYDEAEKSFRDFLNVESFAFEVRDAYYQLAESLRLQQKYLDAISYYNILRYRYPLNRYQKEILFRLGQCYYYSENLQRARYFFLEFLKKEVSLKQKFETYLYLAKIDEKSRAFADAISYFRQVLLLYEKDNSLLSQEKAAELYFRLAQLEWEKLKDRENAYQNLQKAFSLGFPKQDMAKFLLRKLTFFHIGEKNGLIDNSIADIKVDGDDIYIATSGGGLMRYVRSLEKLEKINLPSPQLRSLFVEKDKIYILSFDGIFIYDKKSAKVMKLQTESQEDLALAQKVIKDDRYLYFTTLTKGLIQYDIFNGKMQIFGIDSFLQSNQVYALAADHRFLIIGTLDDGVFIKDKRKNTIKNLRKENGYLKDNNIKALLIDGRFLWIGVHNVGIYRYDFENEKITFLNWKLRYPTVIAKREHEIWIGTTGKGLWIYDQNRDSLERLSGIEGLSSNDIQCLEIEDNYIWIGYLDQGVDVLFRPLN